MNALLLCLLLDLTTSNVVTNRLTNVVSVLSLEAVPTPCPECGAPNHHDLQISYVQVTSQVVADVVHEGQTNRVIIWHGPSKIMLSTNMIPRQARMQPGWPPTPIMPTVVTNYPVRDAKP